MKPTLIVFGLITLLCLLFSSFKQTKQIKLTFLILCSLILIGQMILINPQGKLSDLTAYYNSFYNFHNISLNHLFTKYSYEYGFLLFNWVIVNLTGSWKLYIIICYAIIYFCSFRFIFNNSSNIYISVILLITLGFYGFSLTGLRQTIAMSICIWSYEYIKKRNFIPFCVTMLLAFSFHKSAIVFFPLYFLGSMKLRPFNFILIILFCLIIVSFSSIIMEYFNDVFDKSYGREVFGSYIGRFINLIIYIIILIISYLAYLTDKNYFNVFNNKYNTFIYSFILGITIYSLQFFNIGISSRISMYFIDIFIYVFITNIISEFKHKSDRNILYLCFVVFSIILFFVGIYRNNLFEFSYYL